MVEIGKVYSVDHQRKGKFVMRVDRIDGEWVTGQVVSGRANAMMPYNVADVGDEITVRASMARFALNGSAKP